MTDKTLKFDVTEDEANVILTGLAELPVKHSLGLIQKLQTQAQPQLATVTEEAVGKPELLTEG